ncbi:MAG: radical SAM protein [Rhodospirillaceae bacterium]|nr:radical SAM protein [Rhodospirillaceae bacterium]MBT4486171.1 radical SAM protein [Rhodospirillaceae bacterium]MBT5193512.1 radical SAM protein [Rhodospirillaceae bacterium]MBT7756626.1 radical SAM protein [Rhodospirillaceae bacterium]
MFFADEFADEPMEIRIHDILTKSAANGPGNRYVVWFQGCSLACRDCFNPATHDFNDGRILSVEEIMEDIRRQDNHISGLTISGGEPLQQPAALLALVNAVRRDTGLSIIVFSGYRKDEIERDPVGVRVLDTIDVLVAGRYVPSRHRGSGLLGSSNQILHFLSDRYDRDACEAVPVAEITISRDGKLNLTGVQPPNL